MHFRLLLLAAIAVLAACTRSPAPSDPMEGAQRLAHSALIADTHIDAPYGLQEDGWRDLAQPVEDRNFDFPKAHAGGLDLAFMSIYTPSTLEATGGNRALADKLIDYVEAMAGRAPQRFVIVRSAAEAEAAKAGGRVGLALGMENGAAIGQDLEGLRHFHARGVRYITLAHATSNALSDAAYDPNRQWDGLSPFGEEVVREMNRLGVMVDVSHLSDAAITDVLAVSSAPVIASHSSARHFTPGWERNLSDELIRAIAAKGGVVQINFGSAFLTPEANAWTLAQGAARDAWLAENPGADEAAKKTFEAVYRVMHPYPYARVADVADHIQYVIALAGIDHVGLGSDFDGVGDSLPMGLKSVADYPNLVAELLARGLSEADVAKILGGNLLRVWREVDRKSRESGIGNRES